MNIRIRCDNLPDILLFGDIRNEIIIPGIPLVKDYRIMEAIPSKDLLMRCNLSLWNSTGGMSGYIMRLRSGELSTYRRMGIISV
jgi:hypothetical protein